MFTTSVTTSAFQSLDFSYESTQTFTASAKLSINETIPTGTVDTPINFTFSTGSGVFLAMATNIELYPLIIKTNDANSPTNIFNLSALNQRIYTDFSTQKDFFGNLINNIDTLYVSNTGVLPATLRIDSLFDITPSI
jgi:hypothetical protein